MAIKYRKEEIRDYKLQAVKAIMTMFPEWTDAMLGAAISMTCSGAGILRKEMGIPTLNSNNSKKVIEQCCNSKGKKCK